MSIKVSRHGFSLPLRRTRSIGYETTSREWWRRALRRREARASCSVFNPAVAQELVQAHNAYARTHKCTRTVVYCNRDWIAFGRWHKMEVSVCTIINFATFLHVQFAVNCTFNKCKKNPILHCPVLYITRCAIINGKNNLTVNKMANWASSR